MVEEKNEVAEKNEVFIDILRMMNIEPVSLEDDPVDAYFDEEGPTLTGLEKVFAAIQERKKRIRSALSDLQDLEMEVEE